MKTLIFDTETTALTSNRLLRLEDQPRVIEFYGVLIDLDTGQRFDEYHSLINPEIMITKEITKITNITNEMLKGQPTFFFIPEFITPLIVQSDQLLAHKLSFDMEIIEMEYDRLGSFPSWPNRLCCTVEQTVNLKGYRLNLASLYEYLFNKTPLEAHRAKDDVNTLVQCALELRRRDII
jgi:DNA polymerase III alpha subunit (gram-positive type)